MNTQLIKSLGLAITSGLLLAGMGLAQANGTYAPAANGTYAPAEEHRSMLSAESILQHNQRLLSHTTIGEALSLSSHTKAKALYQEAQRLYEKANDAFKNGRVDDAKLLAFESIATFYKSDKAHYGITN